MPRCKIGHRGAVSTRSMSMTSNQILIFKALTGASVTLFAFPLIIWTVKSLLERVGIKRRRRGAVSPTVVFTAFLMVSIFCMRFSAELFKIFNPSEGAQPLSLIEGAVQALLMSLRTFGMDGDFDKYIGELAPMVTAVFGDSHRWAVGAFASLLSAVAPIVGGAIILEVAAGLFPRFRLFLYHRMHWRKKYYFSELNSSSLSTMHSILNKGWRVLCRPVMIFTDAYADRSDENTSELILEAKLAGAICVREDITQVPMNRWGKRNIFLIDENENANLIAFTKLASEGNSRFLKKARVFVFSQSDACLQLERRIRASLREKQGFASDKMPEIIPIHRFRNLITNTLTELPLYAPLVGKKPNEEGKVELKVSIIGMGRIGREMFLSTYWFCQMVGVKTTVTVMSRESKENFYARLSEINPEILGTCEPLYEDESYPRRSKLLKYSIKGSSEPYLYINYIQSDVTSESFYESLEQRNGIADADYILVSLGTDDMNINAANTVFREVAKRNIADGDAIRKTVIAYVVYNSDLSRTLNGKTRFSFERDGHHDIIMKAVGDRAVQYSIDNLLTAQSKDRGKRLKEQYKKADMAPEGNREPKAKRARKANAVKKDDRHDGALADAMLEVDYKSWSNTARMLHIPYKAFSAGFIDKSCFEYKDGEENEYRNRLIECIKEYKSFVLAEGKYGSSDPEREKMILELAWLEHRRWCAFVRTKGYMSTDDYKKYKDMTDSYKHWELKLQPCLVECDKLGIRTDYGRAAVDGKRIIGAPEGTPNDRLDKLTCDLFEDKLADYDMKKYDYPCDDDFDKITDTLSAKRRKK